jgi:hypothetical protein
MSAAIGYIDANEKRSQNTQAMYSYRVKQVIERSVKACRRYEVVDQKA